MQLFLYCLCGGMGVITDYALFYLAFDHGIGYQGANGLGYLSGTVISFSLNRIFTFDMRDYVLQRFAMFLVVASIGYASSALLLGLLVQYLHMDPRLAKLITLPMVVALQFSLNRRITFKPKKIKQN